MSRSSHRLEMSCVKYLGPTRLYILMCTLAFSSSSLQSIKLWDTVWPRERERERENAVRQEMEQTDRQAGKSLIVILAGPQSVLVTAKSLSEGHGRSHCCLLIREGNTVCFVWSCGTALLSYFKARPWSSVWAAQVGSNFASHVSIWQRTHSRAFKICKYCQYFTDKSR